MAGGSEINTLPTITFTLNGATVTVQETPPATSSAAPSVTPFTTSGDSTTSHNVDTHTTSGKTTSSDESKTSSDESKTSSPTVTTMMTMTGMTASPQPTIASYTLPSSCIESTTIIPDLSAGQDLASSCPTFSGMVVIPSTISTPIDLSGMDVLEGSLICNGSSISGFSSLSSDTLNSIHGELVIENTNGLTNVSFPQLLSMGLLEVANNSDLHSFALPLLTTVSGPIYINGSLASIHLPLVEEVHEYFEVATIEDLDCGNVISPGYNSSVDAYSFNAKFYCHALNDTAWANGTGGIHLMNSTGIPGPRGFDKKDEFVVGIISGVVFLIVVILGIYWWIHRQQIKNAILLARQSARTPKNRKNQFSTANPATPAFSVDGRSPNPGLMSPDVSAELKTEDPVAALYRQRRQLSLKKQKGRLTPFEQERFDFVVSKIVDHEAALKEETNRANGV